jgi:carbon starvation protein
VFAGTLFPFLFITIACGAISGFHSLVSSGTTPKMLDNEVNARYIGYGAMLMESFVAIMALIAACSLEPGIYFAMNSPAALIGTTPETAAAAINGWGFMVTPEMLSQAATDVDQPFCRARAAHHACRRHGRNSIERHWRQGNDGVLVSLRHSV